MPAIDNPGILHDHVSSMTRHSYPHIHSATRNARALHCWLQYHFRPNSYTERSPKQARHTAQFFSGVPKSNTDHVSSMTRHSYPHIHSATRNASALHCWLQYHFKPNSYTERPPKKARHTAQFSSGVPKSNTVT